MMNEARIGVGMAAAMLGMAGYEASLAYARQRPQGRPLQSGGKDPNQPQVPIIEHADIRRMLLAQKAYCEGGLALELYCARLVDELHTGDASAARDANLLLEILTPIAKSWPSEWCLEANSLAIQVHGGYGYTRDFPVEQYWRDNRLNMIHEGTHGIQGLDLLGRKVLMQDGAALKALERAIRQTIAKAGELPEFATQLSDALDSLLRATEEAWSSQIPEEALANATPYLQAFGHVVMGWIWLDIGVTASPASSALTSGLLSALRYFHAYELPKIDAWLKVVRERESVCRDMPHDWF
jgi:butyryl-CoA dehydrogenase